MAVAVAVGGGGLDGLTVGTGVAVSAGGWEVAVSRGGGCGVSVGGRGVGLGVTAVGETTTGGIAVCVGVELGWGVGVFVARASTRRVLVGMGVTAGAPGPHWTTGKLTKARKTTRARDLERPLTGLPTGHHLIRGSLIKRPNITLNQSWLEAVAFSVCPKPLRRFWSPSSWADWSSVATTYDFALYKRNPGSCQQRTCIAKKEDGYSNRSSHPVCTTLGDVPAKQLVFRRRHVLAPPSPLVGCIVQSLLLGAHHITSPCRATKCAKLGPVGRKHIAAAA
jgi:hypothetical protein